MVDCLHVITSLKIYTPVTNVDKPFLRVNFSLAGVADNTRAFFSGMLHMPLFTFHLVANTVYGQGRHGIYRAISENGKNSIESNLALRLNKKFKSARVLFQQLEILG